MLKKIPLPIAGLILALFSLGNLLGASFPIIKPICGIIAGILWILLLAKIVIYPKLFTEDIKNPVIASTFCTFPMATYILSGYLKPYIATFGEILYYLALILHIILIIYFTYTFIIKKFELKNVHASYYVPYVGIVVSAISAPLWDAQLVGKIVFWFGLIVYIPLVYIINKRYISLPNLPDPVKPVACIQAAPAALLLAGYNSVFGENKSTVLIAILTIVALFFYCYVLLFSFRKSIGLNFFPSFSAFTFPFVINPMAMKMTAGFFTKIGNAGLGSLLKVVWIVQLIIATILIFYVLFKYIQFFTKKA